MHNRMEDKDKNLEKFFKDKFSQPIQPESWNTPAFDTWDKIESSFPKKKNRRLFILPLLFTSLLFCTFGYLLYKVYGYEQKFVKLEKQLEACQHSNKQLDLLPQAKTNLPQTHEKQSKNLEENWQSSQAIKLQKQNTAVWWQNSHNSSAKSSLTDSVVRSQNRFPSNDFSHPTEPNLTNQNVLEYNLSYNKQTNVQSFSFNSTQSSISTIPTLPIRPLNSLRKNQLLFYQNALNISEKVQKKPTKWLEIGTGSQYFIWSDRHKGMLDLPLSELLEKEQSSPSFNFGLETKCSISKHITLDLGVFYGTRCQTSQYKLEIPYTLATEIINAQGSVDNTFTHSLPSGLGSINTVLTVNRSLSSTVSNNEKVNIDFAYQNAYQSLFIPLKTSYYLKQSGNGLYGAIGLSSEVGLRNQIKVVQAMSRHTTVHEKAVDITFADNQQKRFNFQTIFESGYQYKFSKNFSTQISMGYQIALNNKYQVGAYKHKIDNLAFGLSLFQRL